MQPYRRFYIFADDINDCISITLAIKICLFKIIFNINTSYNMTTGQDLVRIGVFYDGNYFLHVSNYYNYIHPRRKRLNIAGLHEFVRNMIAREEDVESRFCQVIEAHYFRGRISAQEASQRGNQLYNDRVFDDILMSEGVVTHYLPIRTRGGKKDDKGIWRGTASDATKTTDVAVDFKGNVVAK